jgi:hypothetical protein
MAQQVAHGPGTGATLGTTAAGMENLGRTTGAHQGGGAPDFGVAEGIAEADIHRLVIHDVSGPQLDNIARHSQCI